MKSLVEFISCNENSLSLDKYIQESKNIQETQEEFVLVEPFHKAYDELEEEMADAMLSNNSDPNMFVLTKKVAKDMLKKYPNDIIVFKIPNDDLEQFESDFEDQAIDYEELEKLELKDLL